MAARTIAAEAGLWQRVAERVYQRRRDLGLTANEVVERAGRGLSLAVLSQIENAKKSSYAVRSISNVERALGWMPGSVQGILNGGEPEEVWVPTARVVRHEDGVSSATLPMPDESTVTVQKPPRGERVLPVEWEERFRTLEREVARLKDELAQERKDRLAEKEDRDRQLAEAAASREQRAEANQRRRQQRENETTT